MQQSARLFQQAFGKKIRRAALRAQSDHVTPEQQEGGQKRLLELKGSHLQLLDDSSR